MGRPSSFTGVESDYYWSSTPMQGQERAFFGDVDHGNLLNGSLTTTLRVWPVRGGQRYAIRPEGLVEAGKRHSSDEINAATLEQAVVKTQR